MGLIKPPTNAESGKTLTWRVSNDQSTYANVRDRNGTLITTTVKAAQYHLIPPEVMIGDALQVKLSAAVTHPRIFQVILKS